MESGDYLEVRVYFRNNLREGYSLGKIRSYLLSQGIDKKVVKDVENEFNKGWRIWLGLGLVASILLVTGAIAFLLLS